MQDSLFSYSKKYRLVSKKDFQSVFAQSHKITHKYLIALYKSNQLPYPRLGIIVGKRFVKTAVARNKFKRIIRESFRQRKDALKGLDIVIRVRSEWSPLNATVLRDDIDNLWKTLVNSSAP